MNRINLLPDHYRARQRRAALVLRLGIAGVFTVIGGVAWAGVARAQLGKLAERVEVSQARLAQEQQRARSIELRSAEARTLKAMLAHREQLESPVELGGVLKQLTHLLPESVALTRLSLDVPAPDMTFRGGAAAPISAAPAAPVAQVTRVTLEGVALSDVELAQVVSALAAQKAFANVKLLRSRQIPMNGEVRFGFEVSLEVSPAVTAGAGGRGEVAGEAYRGT